MTIAKNATNTYLGTGRRKTAVARVYLRKGTGTITVNDRSIEEYFGGRRAAHVIVRQPLQLLDSVDKFDITVNVDGSGPMGQADAIRHGIARALVSCDEANRIELRKGGHLTRDSRIVERKKVGHRKARKVEQYSKR